jgi:hypothetical protein
MKMIKETAIRTTGLILALMLLLCSCSSKAPQPTEDNKDLTELTASPLKSTIHEEDGGKVIGRRETYCLKSYGITDIGMLRLAFENLPFTGKSSGTVTLKDDSSQVTGRTSGGSSGTGNRRFEHRSIEGGAQYNFGGIAFTIVNGVFYYKEHSISALDSPRIVLFDDSKSIVSVEDFPTEVDAKDAEPVN